MLLLMLLKLLQVGVGLLSIPYALKAAGWVGLLLLYALGYVACYTGTLKSAEITSTRRLFKIKCTPDRTCTSSGWQKLRGLEYYFCKKQESIMLVLFR